jgi:predicted MFS family arabinose efflux permease
MTPVKSVITLYKDAYSGLPKEAWILSMIEFVNRSGTMVFFFMTLYLTQTYGYSPAKAGQAISAFGLGALAGSYLGGRLSDKIGAYTTQKISLLLTGICFLILCYLTSFVSIITMMCLLGIVSEALHPANATAMSQVCPSELRSKGFALNRLAHNLGFTIGPALGGYLALINYKLLFWVDGLTCIVAFLIFSFMFRTNRPEKSSDSTGKTISISPLKDIYFLKVLLFVFWVGYIFVQIFSTFPLYFKNIYLLKENRIGWLMAINTILIVVIEMILINALKKRNQVKIMAFGALLLGSGYALMPMGRGFLFAALTVIIWTLGEIITIPTMTAHIADISNDSMRGRYMGMFSFAFALSLTIGPALGSFIYDRMGPDHVWYFSGIIGLVLFLGFLRLKPPETV